MNMDFQTSGNTTQLLRSKDVWEPLYITKKKNKKKGQIDYFRQLVNFCYFNPHFCETLSLINLDFLTDFQGGHDGHLPTECPLVQWWGWWGIVILPPRIWLGTGVRIRLREGSRQKGDEMVDGMI